MPSSQFQFIPLSLLKCLNKVHVSRRKFQFKVTCMHVHLILANMTRKWNMYVLWSDKVWTTGSGHSLSRCYWYGHPSERGYVWHIKSRLSPLCDDFFMEASYQFSSHKLSSFPSYIFDVRRIPWWFYNSPELFSRLPEAAIYM